MTEINKGKRIKTKIKNIVQTSNTLVEATNRLLREGYVVTNSQAKRIWDLNR